MKMSQTFSPIGVATSGPWIMHLNNRERFSFVISSKEYVNRICEVYERFGKEFSTQSDQLANACLICAAPDLRDFAQAYIDAYCGFQITNTTDAKHDATGYLRQLADKALLKTTGEKYNERP